MNDKKHGYGEYTWADGRMYLGEWQEAKQHGTGIVVLPNNIAKKGIWQNGKKI